MGIVGETMRVDKVLDMVTEKLGMHFEISTVKADELQKRVNAIEGVGTNRAEMFGKMVSQMKTLLAEDEVGMLKMEPIVNALCPHVQPTSVRDYLDKIASGLRNT